MKTLIEFRNGEQYLGHLEVNNVVFPNGIADIISVENLAKSVMEKMDAKKPYADVYEQKEDDIVMRFRFRV